jgi:hypothetical protein
VAVYLALWQTWRVFETCPFSKIIRLECVPGPGVVITLAAGAVALWQGWRLRPALAPPKLRSVQPHAHIRTGTEDGGGEEAQSHPRRERG